MWGCVCACSQLHLTLLQPHGLQYTKFFCSWDFPGKNTGMGCHFLLQGNLPNPRIELLSLSSPALAGRFFTTTPSGEPQVKDYTTNKWMRIWTPRSDSKTYIPPHWAPWTLGVELSNITNKNIWHPVKFAFQIMNMFFSISISKRFSYKYILSIT